MERAHFSTLLGFILIVSLSSASSLGGEKIPVADVSKPQTTQAPVYKPPRVGAPKVRLVGGGSRGFDDNLPRLSPLAPDHMGFTITDQPVVYWYLSKATTAPMEFTLISDQAIEPLLETRLDSSNKPGVQRLPLSDYKITLRPNTSYEWFVTLVPNDEQRSNDILAKGVIQRVTASGTLRARLKAANKRQLPYIYAEQGLWYDAIAAISKLIEARPSDGALREQRAGLLEQVGLGEVADYDRRIAVR